MTVYETTFVVDGKYPETEVVKLSEKFTQLITAAKGEVLKVDKLGKRELAYKIGSAKDGYYIYIEAKMDGEIVKDLERNYRIADSILRYLTIKKVTVKPIKKKKKKVAAASSTAPSSASARTAAPAAVVSPAPAAAPVAAPVVPPAV